METATEASKIFKTLDGATLLELALIAVGAVVLTVAAQRGIAWLAGRLHGKRRLNVLALAPPTRLLIIIGAVALLVPRLVEPSLQNMVALLGTVGLALGFALKDYASSLIAGLVAIAEKPYRNGDWVEIQGVYGEVRHVGMRTVELVTPDDTLVHIPHGCLWHQPVHNANDGTAALQCVADFYLEPEHDAAAACAALRDVALTSAYLLLERPVGVVVRDRPWGTHYRLKAYPVDPGQQFRFVSDLTVRGRAALGELGARFAVRDARPPASA